MTDSALDVHIERYEGSLDLLIHLIHKHELDIFEVSISEITDRFLEEIHKMLDMDIAAEFIELASFLIYLKSRLMLPIAFADIPEENPEAAFAGKLLELTFAKELSMNLERRESLSGKFLARSDALFVPRENAPQEDPFVLANLFFGARDKKEKKLIVEDTSRQVNEVATKTTEFLLGRKETLWSTLAGIFNGKLRQAVSFGTVLELSKQNRVNSYQDENFTEILIRNEEWVS
jgi:segregation and condensation protein A